MFKNYLKISFRNLIKNKLYSFINIVGLGIGLTSFIIIAIFIKHEFSYDRFNENLNRIYRVSENLNYNGAWQNVAMTPPAFGPALVRDYSEIEDYARFMPFPVVVVGYGDKKYSEEILFADGGVFTMFSFPMLQGNPKNMLNEKFTVAISESTAKKYFGDKNPIGEILNLNTSFNMVVQGVFKDIPKNSHLQFNILISMSSIEDENIYGAGALDNFKSSNFFNYILVAPGTDINSLQERMKGFVNKYAADDLYESLQPYFEPLLDIYLYSDTIFGTGICGDIQYVYIFSAIALFILLIATINFVNLTTSQSMTRAKEIGIRKVTGSNRLNLIVQFLGESIFLTILSFMVGLVLLEVLLPYYNLITGSQLQINYLSDFGFLILLFGISILVGIVAGIYPAFYLSSFESSKILKGEIVRGTKGGTFRKALVMLQFTISVVLISSTLIVNDQLAYLQSKDMGFQKENILFVLLQSPEFVSHTEAIKTKLLQNSNINSASTASRVMGNVYGGWNIYDEADNKYDITTIFADEDYINTMGLKVEEGRGISSEMGTDKENSFMINESAVKKYGWTDVVGKYINLQGIKEGHIVGVLKDFNYRSLHSQTEPLLLSYFPGDYMKRYMMINIKGENIASTIDYIESAFTEFAPGLNIEVNFLDSFVNDLYKSERRFNDIVLYFSTLAILLGCLGLFGLASFAAEKRTKEIGIRKVLGAKASGIVFKLSTDFLKLVIISNVIALPVAYYLMSKWLQDFAYKIDIGLWAFVISFIVSLIVALLTVSFHAIRAAIANPIKSLRYE